ncbi:MAG: hypothetical protein UZ13_03507 [Chloroflexi bacterium OLB13]|nr:MAG: hypothetical protein UZ13_03507 [Chloroflexi bacterium OLB13]
MDVRVVTTDGIGDFFEDGGLAGLGRRDDQPALPAADGGDQVEQAGGEDARRGFEVEADFREDRRQILEIGPHLVLVWRDAVDRVDPQQAVILLVVFRRSHLPDDHIAGAQVEPLDLRLRDVDVVRPRKILVSTQESHPVMRDFEHAAAQLEAAAFGVGAHELQDQIRLLEPAVSLYARIACLLAEFI